MASGNESANGVKGTIVVCVVVNDFYDDNARLVSHADDCVEKSPVRRQVANIQVLKSVFQPQRSWNPSLFDDLAILTVGEKDELKGLHSSNNRKGFVIVVFFESLVGFLRVQS